MSCSICKCPVEKGKSTCVLLNVLQQPSLSSHGEDISLLCIHIQHNVAPSLSMDLATHNQDQHTYRIRVSLECLFVQHDQGNTIVTAKEVYYDLA